MKMSTGLLLTATVMLLLAGILGSSCAAPAAPPPTPVPQATNEVPVISSISANPTQVVAGQSASITAVASDPDDDPITYNWSASQGTISGTGSQVTWTSSGQSGSVSIGLTASDNRGGQATSSVTVTVLPPTTTVTLNPVPAESGTVNQKNATDDSIFIAGDDALNVGYRAFWSFNILSLAHKDIQSANLKFTTGRIVGSPFAYNKPPVGLGGLWLWKDTYGTTLPVFGYVGGKLINTGLMYDPPSVIDVIEDISIPVYYASSRFQVEALFNDVSNGNNAPDSIEWSSVVLEVTYANE